MLIWIYIFLSVLLVVAAAISSINHSMVLAAIIAIFSVGLLVFLLATSWAIKKLERIAKNREIKEMLSRFENEESSHTAPQEQALMKAIKEKKKQDPLAGVKIGSKELNQRLINGLKSKKGVHIESLLAILGSLAGYSCHVGLREELVDSGKHKENEVFTIVGGKDERQYYFGDLPNELLAEGQASIWGLSVGMAQHLGATSIPDLKEIFTYVSSTVGSSEFGIPNIDIKYEPGDLPINYVKVMWKPLLPLMDKFCDRPTERPILIGLAVQQIIELGKDVIPPKTAVELVMKCAIPMSKIGPEWITS
jgi:hypothetical protein